MSTLATLFKRLSSQAHLVIDPKLTRYVPIDISLTNTALLSFDTSSSEAWEVYLQNYLQHNNAQVAYGGYLEVRDLYDRSTYFANLSPENKRNIHLGVDFWCPAETSVHAVLDGTVHSFQENTAHGDYGPTIILEHHVDGVQFYTLYGHLSIKSLEPLSVGMKVTGGDCIATLGDATVNGDYAPHLHFQCIHDLQGKKGDYPGVSALENVPFYKDNCPNPMLLLGQKKCLK